jgi:hypothetical protein
VASSGRSVNMGSILIAIVVVVAAGALFFMRTIAKVSANMANPEMEQVVDDFLRDFNTPKLGSTTAISGTEDQHILEVLDEDYSEIQVPLDSVQFNPFVLQGEEDDTGETPITAPPTDDSERRFRKERDERKAAIMAAANGLTLKSVMMGNPSLANINDSIVREGDTVSINDVEFTISLIEVDVVTASCQDFRYALEIDVPIRLKRN